MSRSNSYLSVIVKTTAALTAVVFLLITSVSCSAHRLHDRAPKRLDKMRRPEPPHQHERRIKRKRASDYSRLPMNTPAGWQNRPIGH